MITPEPVERMQSRLRLGVVAVVALIAGAAMVAVPATIYAQGLVKGAQQGAREGNKAAGPIGGVLGGAIGGVVGAVGSVFNPGSNSTSSSGKNAPPSAADKSKSAKNPKTAAKN